MRRVPIRSRVIFHFIKMFPSQWKSVPPENASMRQQWSACSRGDPPAWMDTPVWPRFQNITRLRILGALNALAFIFHASFMSIVLALSANLDNWETTRGVTLPIYKAKLEWYAASEMNMTTNSFELVPTLIRGNDQQHINLTMLTVAFFGLSALFHLFIVALSIKGTTYFWWIDECRQPLRFIEYSASASIMILVMSHAILAAHHSADRASRLRRRSSPSSEVSARTTC